MRYSPIETSQSHSLCKITHKTATIRVPSMRRQIYATFLLIRSSQPPALRRYPCIHTKPSVHMRSCRAGPAARAGLQPYNSQPRISGGVGWVHVGRPLHLLLQHRLHVLSVCLSVPGAACCRTWPSPSSQFAALAQGNTLPSSLGAPSRCVAVWECAVAMAIRA